MQMEPGEPVGAALRRMACEQLEVARAGFAIDASLDEVHLNVHAARKATKRARALLRLVRPLLGDEVYRNENAVIRDQSRRLAPMRSAAVTQNTLQELIDNNAGGIPVRILTAVRDEMSRRATSLLEEFQAGGDEAAAARTSLATAAARISRWTGLDGLDDQAAMTELLHGLRRSYTAGQDHMRAARKAVDPDEFHEWRKDVNHLRYQLEALSPRLPPAIAGLDSQFDRLAALLGDEHDLADLANLIEEEPSLLPAPVHLAQLLEAIDKRRSDLQRSAMKVGKKLYSERADKFVGRLERHWRSGGRPNRR